MPYIIIRGNLASYSHKYPWRVLVSGLKGKSLNNQQQKKSKIELFTLIVYPKITSTQP